MIDTKYLCEVANGAGDEILKFYHLDDVGIQQKNDESPLTKADLASDKYIDTKLKEKYPNIPILSEENFNHDYNLRQNWKSCFIIDPLDGTREFIKKNGEFTVNIAYVENGIVQEGVIYAPVRDELYYSYRGVAFKEAANKTYKLPLITEPDFFKVVASRSHKNKDTEDFINQLKVKYPQLEKTTVGSSLKFCLIASGEAQVYPRLGNIMEWDIAAAHGILKAAGGDIVDFHTGVSLKYNKESLKTPWFIASLDAEFRNKIYS